MGANEQTNTKTSVSSESRALVTIFNMSSNTPETSYPSGPSRKNPLRRSIVGGYVIDNATCVAWGSRIVKVQLNPEKDSFGALSIVMRELEEKYRTRFIMFGPESYKQYSVSRI